jgi:hypothetical protein
MVWPDRLVLRHSLDDMILTRCLNGRKACLDARTPARDFCAASLTAFPCIPAQIGCQAVANVAKRPALSGTLPILRCGRQFLSPRHWTDPALRLGAGAGFEPATFRL